MKNFPFLMGLVLLCFNISANPCFSQTNTSKKFQIDGRIKGIQNGTLVKLFAIDELKVLDSAYSVGETFVLRGTVKQPTSCWVKCLNEYATIEVENVAMKFDASIKQMNLNAIASGGREQTLHTLLNEKLRPFENIYLPLYNRLNNKLYKDSAERAKMVSEFNKANDAYMNTYILFGKKNINSYLGLDIVFRNRKTIPKDSVLMLFNQLSIALQKTAKGEALKTYASTALAKKGEKFIDFSAYSIDGKLVKLSDFNDKFIYLTFGSYSCGPCRIENRDITKIYASLSQQVNVVNFSLDVNKKEWQLAAKEDQITWANISDLAGVAGKIKTLYNVQAMPTSFLIDKNGIIVEHFIGYNPDNLEKIKSLVGVK